MNTPLNLIIHRGSDQIGGMCVEISHSDTRVIVDAGTPLPDLNAGDEPVPGEEILPEVRGVFDSDSRAVSALLLSHSHGDHSGLLHRVLPSIPVHLSKGASQMLMAASIYARGKRLQQPEKTFTDGKAFDIGHLRVTPFIVDHSTFGASAFVIEGGGRRVIYSGDLRMHGPHQRLMSSERAAKPHGSGVAF